MPIKLSIITINLNNADGLRKTIESVVSQTLTDFEYIVIDGASTDGSVEIIKQYADKITYWISEPDKGIYNAMNKGILKATGEYCLFLNSGDWFVQNILSTISTINFTKDIIHGNTIVAYNDGTVSIHKGCPKNNLTFYDLYTDTICHQAAFIRRTLFFDYGLYEEQYRIASDWLFFVQAIVFGKASTAYYDINIAYFDAYGICMTEHDPQERSIMLGSLLPNKIIEDYKRMIKQDIIIYKLKLELNRYQHRFYYFDLILSKIKLLFALKHHGS
jgi:glycosyltransferase involved in cell wall biosynthesis